MHAITSCCQSSNPKSVLNYNISNLQYLLLNNNKKDIGLEVSNNGKKGIKPIDIDIDKEDIRSSNINK